MPSNAAAEPGPGLPELVLRAARDLDKVGTAFDAELLFSTLLGSVYAGSLPDRAMALESFGHTLREYLSGTDTGPARVAARVLDALTPGADRQPDRGTGGPAWLGALGAVR